MSHEDKDNWTPPSAGELQFRKLQSTIYTAANKICINVWVMFIVYEAVQFLGHR